MSTYAFSQESPRNYGHTSCPAPWCRSSAICSLMSFANPCTWPVRLFVYVLQMVMRLFLERGDRLMCEDFTYPHVYESMALPMGIGITSLCMDDRGIVPASFKKALDEVQGLGQHPPRLLYTVPTGQNPTGALAPMRLPSLVWHSG